MMDFICAKLCSGGKNKDQRFSGVKQDSTLAQLQRKDRLISCHRQPNTCIEGKIKPHPSTDSKPLFLAQVVLAFKSTTL